MREFTVYADVKITLETKIMAEDIKDAGGKASQLKVPDFLPKNFCAVDWDGETFDINSLFGS